MANILPQKITAVANKKHAYWAYLSMAI